MSQVLSGPCDRSRLHSARLLPCASSFSEEVVEGTHHVMVEGTGLEPYSPCQSLVRGQGGLEDVQACVDLTIHLPVANEAHEILAHPISAPGATHWAGLTGPLRVDLDDGHALAGVPCTQSDDVFRLEATTRDGGSSDGSGRVWREELGFRGRWLIQRPWPYLREACSSGEGAAALDCALASLREPIASAVLVGREPSALPNAGGGGNASPESA